jgi:Polyketide cyclase / dehydrase and lipid transport
MTWQATASATTTAEPEQIWALWSDVSSWNGWDHEVVSSSLDGAFVLGTTGTLKPRGGPATRFVITDVRPMISFSDRSRLPLATIDFHHRLSVADGITTIEHSVVMNGPLTPVFRRLIGTKIAKGLPTAVAALAALAEGAT